MRLARLLPIVAPLFLLSLACTRTDRASAPAAAVGSPPSGDPRGAAAPAVGAPIPTVQGASKMDEAPSSPPGAAGRGVATPEPPYDLEADRQRRAAAAKRELGPRTVVAVVSDIFVVIGPPGWQGQAFDQSVSLMKSSMAAYMNNRFAKKPAQAISVYLFAEGQSYERFCKQQYDAPCIAHYGFYQPSDRYMVMNAGLGLGTLTHEIVHPLVESDFPQAPTWLNEGIASLFEAPMITKPGEIHGAKNWRHPRLKRAMTSQAEKDHARLDTVFGMADTTFRGENEDLHYALARYICQWLDERGKLWSFYQRWRDTVATDPTGAKAFEEIVGMTPAAANVPWSKWALAL